MNVAEMRSYAWILYNNGYKMSETEFFANWHNKNKINKEWELIRS